MWIWLHITSLRFLIFTIPSTSISFLACTCKTSALSLPLPSMLLSNLRIATLWLMLPPQVAPSPDQLHYCWIQPMRSLSPVVTLSLSISKTMIICFLLTKPSMTRVFLEKRKEKKASIGNLKLDSSLIVQSIILYWNLTAYDVEREVADALHPFSKTMAFPRSMDYLATGLQAPALHGMPFFCVYGNGNSEIHVIGKLTSLRA